MELQHSMPFPQDTGTAPGVRPTMHMGKELGFEGTSKDKQAKADRIEYSRDHTWQKLPFCLIASLKRRM